MDRLDRIEEAVKYMNTFFATYISEYGGSVVEDLLSEPEQEDSDFAKGEEPPIRIIIEPIKITADNWMEYWGKWVWVGDDSNWNDITLCGYKEEQYPIMGASENWVDAYATDPTEFLKQQEVK